MRINTNVSALNAWRNIGGTDVQMSRNLERLSSGFRINRAADDAAGLAVSEKMRAQIRGINQAVRNAQDGISLVQTAEGALTEMHTMLQRMRELAVQSGNDTLQSEDRKQIQSEMDQLTREITRITTATQFNAKDLINGAMKNADAQGLGGISELTLQIGPNNGQTLTFGIDAMDSKSLGITRDVMTGQVDNGVDGTGAQIAATVIDTGAVGTDKGFGEVGAGLTAGNYQVQFDVATNTVRLFESDGTTAIGQAVDWQDGAAITLGDGNTGRTVEVTLLGTAPVADQTDYINIASMDATVVADSTGASTFADGLGAMTSGTGAITAVGYGMSDDTQYRVSFDGAGNAELQTAAGQAIGGTTAVTGAGNITVGDAATGRTLSIDVLAAAAGTAGFLTIEVQNNGKSAEEAKFAGGVKTQDARAFAGLDVMSSTSAQTALDAIDKAVNTVSYQRAQLGSIQNRLEHTVNNLQVVSENLSASESRIRDVDMALEMTHFSKNQILMQAGTAMLAQANAKTQAVLSLLKG